MQLVLQQRNISGQNILHYRMGNKALFGIG